MTTAFTVRMLCILRPPVCLAALAMPVCLCLPACTPRAATVENGDPARGKLAIEQRGCIACHVIPGVAGPEANVGPPLKHVANRAYIGGVLPNQPPQMIRWLMNPPAVDPRTAMPDIGLSEPEARDIAAYLYTLE